MSGTDATRARGGTPSVEASSWWHNVWRPFWAVPAACAVSAVALGLAWGRMGCFLAGCCFGVTFRRSGAGTASASPPSTVFSSVRNSNSSNTSRTFPSSGGSRSRALWSSPTGASVMMVASCLLMRPYSAKAITFSFCLPFSCSITLNIAELDLRLSQLTNNHSGYWLGRLVSEDQVMRLKPQHQ